MPSRPMFTIPARSAHRPPSPAMPIGTASTTAALSVPLDAMSSAPVITLTSASTNSAPAM